MKVKDLFELKYGVNLELMRCEETIAPNGVNFVARTSQNNGVVARVEIIDGIEPQKAGTLSCATSGSVLSTFVQNEPYYSGRDLYVLTPRVEMTLEQKLFYAMIITKNKYRYNYGRAANKTLGDIEIPTLEECSYIINDYLATPIKTHNDGKFVPIFNTEEWGDFYLHDIFDVEYGNKFDLDKMTLEKPEINFVSRTAGNCGIAATVDLIVGKKPFNAGCMTIALGGSIGSTFYQREPFYTAQNVAILKDKLNFIISKYAKLFIKTIIELEVGIRFRAFGRELNKHIKRNFPISLPQTSEGNPDFEYMENYIKKLPFADRI